MVPAKHHTARTGGAQGAAHNEQPKGADCVLRIDLEEKNMVARVRDGEDFYSF